MERVHPKDGSWTFSLTLPSLPARLLSLPNAASRPRRALPGVVSPWEPVRSPQILGFPLAYPLDAVESRRWPQASRRRFCTELLPETGSGAAFIPSETMFKVPVDGSWAPLGKWEEFGSISEIVLRWARPFRLCLTDCKFWRAGIRRTCLGSRTQC